MLPSNSAGSKSPLRPPGKYQPVTATKSSCAPTGGGSVPGSRSCDESWRRTTTLIARYGTIEVSVGVEEHPRGLPGPDCQPDAVLHRPGQQDSTRSHSPSYAAREAGNLQSGAVADEHSDSWGNPMRNRMAVTLAAGALAGLAACNDPTRPADPPAASPAPAVDCRGAAVHHPKSRHARRRLKPGQRNQSARRRRRRPRSSHQERIERFCGVPGRACEASAPWADRAAGPAASTTVVRSSARARFNPARAGRCLGRKAVACEAWGRGRRQQ